MCHRAAHGLGQRVQRHFWLVTGRRNYRSPVDYRPDTNPERRPGLASRHCASFARRSFSRRRLGTAASSTRPSIQSKAAFGIKNLSTTGCGTRLWVYLRLFQTCSDGHLRVAVRHAGGAFLSPSPPASFELQGSVSSELKAIRKTQKQLYFPATSKSGRDEHFQLVACGSQLVPPCPKTSITREPPCQCKKPCL